MSGRPKMTSEETQRFWSHPPPEPSPGLRYWTKEVTEHGYRRNRRIGSMGYPEATRYFGVYIWEWVNVLLGLMTEWEAKPRLRVEPWRHGRSYGPVPADHPRDTCWACLKEAAAKAANEDPVPGSEP